jgi:peptidoglycan hydrolase-like protein with peptidoglycan-binding domain
LALAQVLDYSINISPETGSAPFSIKLNLKNFQLANSTDYKIVFGDTDEVFNLCSETAINSCVFNGPSYSHLAQIIYSHTYQKSGTFLLKILSVQTGRNIAASCKDNCGEIIFSKQIIVKGDSDNQDSYCPNLYTKLNLWQKDPPQACKGDIGMCLDAPVYELQKFLQSYYKLPSTFPTGYFGARTNFYVQKFKKENGLTPVSTVGAATISKIKEICAKKKNNISIRSFPEVEKQIVNNGSANVIILVELNKSDYPYYNGTQFPANEISYLVNGQTVPSDVLNSNLQAERNAVATTIENALQTLTPEDFTLVGKFDLTPGFSGSLKMSGYQKLLNNSSVRNISLNSVATTN